ncbi:LysR family transcriptional regulator [Vibrio sp. SS-MA-C1-2]|uniref:LysR family transcriptional regulator n=1 Tax=Vibrio sp. SS-MA-C1-2 TaxID=2908646 RepID=UPI001F2F32DC|nr:LysR family transcriptional regulator [Vibrio sp. SS-MA-C1-2]UJF17859.1 LysR family transcriptional regulator [Vibrio sp. SS-MA-C1-2]
MNNNFNIPNLRHLRAIVEVVHTGSITKASEVVFLSQPAITQAISKLENNINCELFERLTDGMHPTKQGKAFAFRIERALELISQGISQSLKAGTGQRKTIVQRYLFNITTTQLKALVAVSDGQSFTEASRILGVSQSSVYRSSKDLESILDITLFEKTSTGISISKAGKFFVKAVKLAFIEIKQGVEEVTLCDNIVSSVINIGCLPLARTCLLPKTVNQFLDTCPDCSINIIDGPYNNLLDKLRNGDIDILIGALRFPSPYTDIRQETLFQAENKIVGRFDHPLLSQKLVIDDLQKASWVVYGKNSPARSMFESIFTEQDLEIPTRLIEASSQVLIREILLGSDRLALLSEHQIERELKDQQFAILPFNSGKQVRPIGLTLRKNWYATETQNQFLQQLRVNGVQL